MLMNRSIGISDDSFRNSPRWYWGKSIYSIGVNYEIRPFLNYVHQQIEVVAEQIKSQVQQPGVAGVAFLVEIIKKLGINE